MGGKRKAELLQALKLVEKQRKTAAVTVLSRIDKFRPRQFSWQEKPPKKLVDLEAIEEENRFDEQRIALEELQVLSRTRCMVSCPNPKRHAHRM